MGPREVGTGGSKMRCMWRSCGRSLHCTPPPPPHPLRAQFQTPVSAPPPCLTSTTVGLEDTKKYRSLAYSGCPVPGHTMLEGQS